MKKALIYIGASVFYLSVLLFIIGAISFLWFGNDGARSIFLAPLPFVIMGTIALFVSREFRTAVVNASLIFK